MKRRMKLFTSIASLSLAVALLVFGVLAANEKNVSISGTVAFEATNVSATVEIYAGVGAAPAGPTYTGFTKYDQELKFVAGTQSSQDQKTANLTDMLSAVEVNDGQVFTVVYVIKNDFLAGSNVQATLSGLATSTWYEATQSSTASGIATIGVDTVITVTYTVDAERAPQTSTIDLAGLLQLERVAIA